MQPFPHALPPHPVHRDFAKDTATVLISVPFPIPVQTHSVCREPRNLPFNVSPLPRFADPRTTPVSSARLGGGGAGGDGDRSGGLPAPCLPPCPAALACRLPQPGTPTSRPSSHVLPPDPREPEIAERLGRGWLKRGIALLGGRFGDQNQGSPSTCGSDLVVPWAVAVRRAGELRASRRLAFRTAADSSPGVPWPPTGLHCLAWKLPMPLASLVLTFKVGC